MPKKPQPQKKIASVLVNGEPIKVTLYSPRGSKRTWYASWKGLRTARSTKQVEYAAAVRAVEAMLQNGGKVPNLSDTLMTDDEFQAIQGRHFGKKSGPTKARGAEKSLASLLEAIQAFKSITGLTHVAAATPADCERFQHVASGLPKSWRRGEVVKLDEAEGEDATLSPTTIVKWSRELRAAFERANSNAGRKCVRSVVPERKLLTSNPWNKFTWIEERERVVHQFSEDDLLSLLDFFEKELPLVPLAAAYIRFLLWTWGRRFEVSELQWDKLHRINENEMHFDILGKWGVQKWARVPRRLYDNVLEHRTDNPFVFAAFPQQLKAHYQFLGLERAARRVCLEFKPKNLGDRIYDQVKKWQEQVGKEAAYLHMFRKTTLQYALSGEGITENVAADARLGEGVMMTSYARLQDVDLRNKSNRTYRRILASLPPEVARRYGYEYSEKELPMEQLEAAQRAGDWPEVGRLAEQLNAL